MRQSDPRRYLRYLAAEREAGHLYRALAKLTAGDRRDALLELAAMEDKHAAHWVALLQTAGVEPPADPGLPDAAAEIVERAERESLDAILPALEATEREAEGEYDSEPDAPASMAADERLHAQVLHRMQRPQRPARTPSQVRQALNRAEPWHRTDRSGSLRAAVFGVSDGLVSNTALVMGFAGASEASETVLFAGVAGLLAGAFSMAAGEYVSMASQRDMFNREIALEAEELATKPEEEQRELELLYRAKGIDRDTAKRVAAQVMSDPKTALDTLAREELGLDPAALGSPIKAAGSSFGAFAIGAIIPVVPYVFLRGAPALGLGIVLAVIALVVVGGAVGRMSGAGTVRSAMRQLLVGGGAAGITYGIGRLVEGSI